MTRRTMGAVLGAVLMTAGLMGAAFADDLKVIQTRKAKDLVITLLSESGQWTQGNNDFVLEVTSAKTKEPVDVGKVSLNTSMAMPGMAPMLAGATLSPDKTPGRYTGTINFADSGARQVSVTWAGPAGKGSTKFTVSVR
ncbi:MAG: FixH family protein [Candidatus Rokubacteria bacterium]|nr:FixH family protein [Candidatus Rokubacteria bacterium]